MARLAVALLGPFQVTLDGEPATGFVSDKARALLAYLLVEVDRPHRRESLAGLLWPEYPESSARTSLRRALANVRQVIGDRQANPPFLLISRQTIQVDRQADFVLDAGRFRELVKMTPGDSAIVSGLEEALELYRGDFMEGFSLADSPAFEEWQLLTRESLRKQVIRILYWLTQHFENEGANERALNYAQRQIMLDPYREAAHRQVMQLLALGGQRAEALAHYEELRQLLKADLDVAPAAETQSLRASLMIEETPAGQSEPLDAPPEPRGSTLPAQLTRFIGRRREMAEVGELLAEARLLTLTGPPGIGKSRLAIEVAAAAQESFADGVYFVDLAVISDPELVASAIGRSLDLKTAAGRPLPEALNDYLAPRCLLVLLDNFEQVVGAATLIGDLLAAAPGLTALVTSREPLRIYGEQEYPVPSLQLPDLTRLAAPNVLSGFESVALFDHRAKAVRPSFAIGEANAAAVAEICVRLDGLPLAIELAAARCKLFTPQMIQARLNSRLAILTGGSRNLSPRQRALRAAIDWSYDLLDESERKLLARLSVFQGGRTVEAADFVCAAGLMLPVVEGLESLHNKSLVQQELGHDGEPRFLMLETIHEYARERLDQSEEGEEICRRHAEYFALLAEQSEFDLFRDRPDICSARLRAELENLRAALAWSLRSGRTALGLRLTGSLREFWYGEGLIEEGLRWLEQGLAVADRAESAGVPPSVRAKALNAAGMLAVGHGDLERGQELLQQALSLARESGDESNAAWALVFLGGDKMGRTGEYEEGIDLCQEALALFRKLDDRPGAIQALTMTGELARLSGDYQLAQEAYEECLVVSRQIGHRLREALTYTNLSSVAMHNGDYDRADLLIKEEIAILRELGLKYYMAAGLALYAGPMLARGEFVGAAQLLGAADSHLEEMGIQQVPADQREIDRYVNHVRDQLTAPGYEAAFAKGQAMSLDEAFALASGDAFPA
ncbi:MAG: tetratricopeptide repeat protein [Chloroflexota bacterium]|nr:MAG: tetratricopeptide repeat protein [Chloroflexota bacterium]